VKIETKIDRRKWAKTHKKKRRVHRMVVDGKASGNQFNQEGEKERFTIKGSNQGSVKNNQG